MEKMLHLLVLNYPNQSEPFRISADHVEKARSRSKRGHLPLTVDICLADAPDLAGRIARADAILGPDFPRNLVASHARRLKLVQATAAGVDHLLPLDWLPQGVTFATASGVHEGPKLMEWAMMTFLMLHTGMPHFVTAQREHRWSRLLSGSVAGRTALIYGTGPIGRTIAVAARRLDITAIGVRRRADAVPGFARVVTTDQADDLIPDADFVVLATPLTPETHQMMDRAAFMRMRPGAHFANFGRGGLVDQEALVEMLENGHLGGAIIDVTTPEPPEPSSLLWDAPRLIITPHLSSDDPDSHVSRVLDILMENLHRLIAGEEMGNLIDDGDRSPPR